MVWAENMSCLMGLTEFIDDRHSAYLLDLILENAAVPGAAATPARSPG